MLAKLNLTINQEKEYNREYNDNKLPTSWRVWPHSESKGWCDRIENIIKYE